MDEQQKTPYLFETSIIIYVGARAHQRSATIWYAFYVDLWSCAAIVDGERKTRARKC